MGKRAFRTSVFTQRIVGRWSRLCRGSPLGLTFSVFPHSLANRVVTGIVVVGALGVLCLDHILQKAIFCLQHPVQLETSASHGSQTTHIFGYGSLGIVSEQIMHAVQLPLLISIAGFVDALVYSPLECAFVQLASSLLFLYCAAQRNLVDAEKSSLCRS